MPTWPKNYFTYDVPMNCNTTSLENICLSYITMKLLIYRLETTNLFMIGIVITRGNQQKLLNSFEAQKKDQNSFMYLGPIIWNSIYQ